MNKKDIYEYFILQTDLHEVLIKWLKKQMKDTPYEKMLYQIIKITLLENCCIGCEVKFLDGDIEIEESYIIDVKELENVI